MTGLANLVYRRPAVTVLLLWPPLLYWALYCKLTGKQYVDVAGTSALRKYTDYAMKEASTKEVPSEMYRCSRPCPSRCCCYAYRCIKQV